MTSCQRVSTKTTGWGNCEEPEPHVIYFLRPNMHHHTHIMQSPTKLLKLMHVSLFDLLPTKILADIYICLYVHNH